MKGKSLSRARLLARESQLSHHCLLNSPCLLCGCVMRPLSNAKLPNTESFSELIICPTGLFIQPSSILLSLSQLHNNLGIYNSPPPRPAISLPHTYLYYSWPFLLLLLLLLSCLVSDSVRPQRRQPTRLSHPWDSPGKNTGVGCCCLLRWPFLLYHNYFRINLDIYQSGVELHCIYKLT